MKNRQGLTVIERIIKDIELAETSCDVEEREMLAYMALGAAEFAIDFGLISYNEWGNLAQRAFPLFRA
jgi:hypothetical protein